MLCIPREIRDSAHNTFLQYLHEKTNTTISNDSYDLRVASDKVRGAEKKFDFVFKGDERGTKIELRWRSTTKYITGQYSILLYTKGPFRLCNSTM